MYIKNFLNLFLIVNLLDHNLVYISDKITRLNYRLENFKKYVDDPISKR